MSRTFHRVVRTAARAVVRSVIAVGAMSALLLWSGATDLWLPRHDPTPRVPPAPRSALALPEGPPTLAPPEPLDTLMVSIKTENDVSSDERALRHIEHFATWTPSSRARDAVVATVGPRLGSPGTFTNAWCDNDHVCWTVADTQFLDVQGQRLAMVTAAGVAVNETGLPETCHACDGYLSLLVLSPRGDRRWHVDAVRRGIRSGEFGAPGLVRTVALGPSIPGWTVEDAYGGQGFNDWTLRAFAVEGRSIRPVLSTPTAKESPDSLTGCSGETHVTTMRFDATAVDEGFYRLVGERTDRRWNGDDTRLVARIPVQLRYRSEIRSYRGLNVGDPSRPFGEDEPGCDQ